MLIDFNFSSISWTIFYLRVGSQMVCFPDRFWSDALADLTNICLFAFGLLATSRYYIVHVLASACAVEGCAEARSVAAPKESAPTSGLTFSIAKGKTMARSPPRKLQVARRDILQVYWQEHDGVTGIDVQLMLQSWHHQCSTCLPRFELIIKHPWWHSQSLCLRQSSLPIALLLQGGSQAKEYVGYIPDIFLNDSETICLVYPWHIPDIFPNDSEKICLEYPWHIPDIRQNDSEEISQTYFEIYLVYDTPCHIPGISRNMSGILHKWEYPRYIPRISNFYRFQMNRDVLLDEFHPEIC
jgi:hypothetical protein